MPLNAIRRKQLVKLVPEGLIITRKWLIENGFEAVAIDNLVKSDQLTGVSNGIYYRGRKPTSWQSIVFTLQQVLKLDLAVGGLTALELHGLHHYVPMSKKTTVHLYGTHSVPRWVNTLLPSVRFKSHKTGRLMSAKKASNSVFTTTYDWGGDDQSIIISEPSRAILEVLLDVPGKFALEHAMNLMQQCTSLSPLTVQKLLVQCRSVKVKRLFLLLAEKLNYSWFAKLDMRNIGLGSGNRVVISGGKLVKKYKVTVPPEFLDN